tara:strand:+ start:1508 stop:1720 length:213 start_codon:yes stop_codon:yes gene_type:complete
MLIVAIILAFILIYLLNSQNVPKENNTKPIVNRRVGGAFTYNDMFDITRDELPVNTVTGPGGGSLVKKFV